MIEIAWIFPDHLSTYGDRGNIIALEYRCRARGIPVRVHRVAPGERLPHADLVFIGGGQDRLQTTTATAIGGLRDAIAAEIREGAVVLGVCAGFQFLGRYYVLPDGSRIAGLDLLDVTTTAGTDRLVGKIVVRPDAALGLAESLVGFENHSGCTTLGTDSELRALGAVVSGHGNNGKDGVEGAFRGTVFGTYLHGPLLPNNPHLTDLLLRLALRRQGGSDALAPLDDTVEHIAAAAFLPRGDHG